MTPIKDKYRIVIDDSDPKKWVVELLAPCAPFHGVLYSYGEFSLNAPESENKEPKFSFQTEIIYVPDHLKNVTFPDEVGAKMDRLLAEILIDIIDTHASKAKKEDGKVFLELVKDDK